MRMTRWRQWVLPSILCAVLTGSPAAAMSSSPVPGEPHAELMAALDEVRRAHDISALGLAVVDLSRDGSSYSTGLGTLAHHDPEPVNGATVFRIGSITKGITAFTLLRLQAQGRIGLDDPLRRHLDTGLWTNAWSGEHPVTLAQLLEHSGGFPDIGKAEWDVAEALPLRTALQRHAPWHRTRWQPGHYASYSNLGAGLVGLAMESATGIDYEKLVRTQLLEPLGMKDSGFEAERVRVTGYDRDGRTRIPYWHMVYRPFGALNASVEDMARYVRWHLRRGRVGENRLLPEDVMQRVEQPATTLAGRHGLAWGYGLGNYAWLRNGVAFHGHGGDADGYLSRMAYSHELGRGYFLVINAFNGQAMGVLRGIVERHLIADHSARAPPPAVRLDREVHAWLEGNYRHATSRRGSPYARQRLSFSVLKGGLRYAGGHQAHQLVAVRSTPRVVLFRYPSQNRATAIALRAEDGSVHFIDESMNLVKVSGPD